MMLGRDLRSWMDNLSPREQHTVGTAPKFKLNDLVLVRVYGKREKWIQGTIIKIDGTKFYQVKTSAGTVRRHVDQMLLSKRKLEETTQSPSGPCLMSGQPEISTHEDAAASHTSEDTITTYEPHDESYLPSTEISFSEPQPPRRSSRLAGRSGGDELPP
ncbi:hypothetical protein RF11_06951 [Thelohanellus kitauei]|uniref:Uncharacterized protein n=1 Tax=Thelohanellus kitauei TaxID=669202 RepID=A0A0C2IYL8_THEKT|nr:hypothetical protein RF11_06951 [Thelohanellus kitauei]